MKADAKKILEEAMHLEPSTRAFIAETLLESLDFEEDFEISQAWGMRFSAVASRSIVGKWS